MISADAIAIALSALLGLLVGSFLNVVIYRLPRGESLVSPGSRCPHCGVAIKRRHNVPVLGWLMLRGRCAACREPISVRYPLVELGTAALFAAVAWRLGVSPYLPAYLFLAALAITLAMIDADGAAIPKSLVLPGYVIGAGLLIPAVASSGGPRRLGSGVLGVAIVVAAYVAASLMFQRTVEPGIVLLAGLLGFYLGWLSWLVVVVAAGLALALVAAAQWAVTTTGRRIGASSLPIATLVAAAAGVAMLVPLPIPPI